MSGKTVLVKKWSERTKTKVIQAVLHPYTTEQDLFGHMLPNESAQKSQKAGDALAGNAFVWSDGPVRQAAREGCLLHLKGVHLPSPGVLESLNSILCAKPGEGSVRIFLTESWKSSQASWKGVSFLHYSFENTIQNAWEIISSRCFHWAIFTQELHVLHLPHSADAGGSKWLEPITCSPAAK